MKMPWNRPPPAATSPSVDLIDRVRGLEARITDMTASVGLMRVEWAEVLDKINRWASRQSGRLAKQAKDNLDAAAQDDPSGTISGREGTGVRVISKDDLRRLANQRRHPNGANQ